MRSLLRHGFAVALFLGAGLCSWAFDAFKVSDIRVEGLQRISVGTIFNYLPIKVGQEFDEKKSAAAVRALFQTGFFKDVRLERDGSVLVVVVVERPSIASIKVIGNKDVESDSFKENFKKLGFVEGQVYNQSLLDKIEQELRRLYFSQGKYGVRIKTTVTPLERNRVAIEVDISEGRSAKIRKITLVGNEKFSNKVLLKKFTLTTPTAISSIYSKNDQYSKQKLAGDLETLRSFYHDRGYLEFKVNSTQVSISPDKQEIYLTVNLTEGEQYKVKEIKLAGRLVVPAEELQKFVDFSKGSVYSLKDVTESTKKLTERLGDEGYAFARVNPVPDLDKAKKEVSITLFIDPGRRVYVRRILMLGNLRTSDLVLRREMRQMEGGWYSAQKIKRSEVRLQRLGFFSSVEVKTNPVTGSNDQVDVVFTVQEKPSGNFLASIGYSQTAGVIFQTSVEQDNFLGTGRRVGVGFNNSEVSRAYKFNYTNPYFTKDGVSFGFAVKIEETDAAKANLSNYLTDEQSFSFNYGIPINENDRIRLSLEYKNLDVTSTVNSPAEVTNFINTYGRENVSHIVSLSYSHDTRNRAIFADRGVLHRISAEVAIPSGDLQYYKASYRGHWYQPLSKKLTMSLKGEIGYAEAYGDTASLPFYENFFAGGSRSIRGFRDNTLGPRDSLGNPIGGAYKLAGSTELIFPPPFGSDSKAFRMSAFVDFGNVFDKPSSFEADQLRVSTGLSLIWISPIGPMAISFAYPLKKEDIDQDEVVQFTLGGSFF